MSFAGKGQELPRAEPVGDVVCGRRARIAPRRACRGCRLREDVVCGKRARIAPRRACRGCRLREKGKNCPARDLAGMSFAGEGQELSRAEPVGDAICEKGARIAPRRVWRGCRLREKDKNCPAQSLSGMSFAGEGQELPRAEPVGDVVCGRGQELSRAESGGDAVCGRRTIIAPGET